MASDTHLYKGAVAGGWECLSCASGSSHKSVLFSGRINSNYSTPYGCTEGKESNADDGRSWHSAAAQTQSVSLNLTNACRALIINEDNDYLYRHIAQTRDRDWLSHNYQCT